MHFFPSLSLLVILTCAQLQLNDLKYSVPVGEPFNFLKHGTDWPGTCQTGKTQSPIDITEFPTDPDRFQVVTAQNSTFREIRLDIGPVRKQKMIPMMVVGLALYWMFDYSFTQNVLGEDSTYILAEIHYISPSAHLFNGVRYPLELHLAFTTKYPDGNIVPATDVIILYKEGNPDPLQTALLGDALEFDLRALFPPNQVVDDYYYYLGSVDIPTTECWEPLSWLMPNYVLEASRDQIQFWKDLYLTQTADLSGWGTMRDVQPLNDRVIYHYVTPETSDSFLG